MTADRYWELRWRDEHATNESLRDEIEILKQRLEFAEWEWNRAITALQAAQPIG